MVISRLFKAQGYLTTATNAISSVILIMTIRHAYKVTQKKNQVNVNIDNQLQLNGFVTSMHISLIISSAIGAFLSERPHLNQTTAYREYSAYTTLTTFQEIFLAYNMFFILDDGKRPDIVRDEARDVTY